MSHKSSHLIKPFGNGRHFKIESLKKLSFKVVALRHLCTTILTRKLFSFKMLMVLLVTNPSLKLQINFSFKMVRLITINVFLFTSNIFIFGVKENKEFFFLKATVRENTNKANTGLHSNLSTRTLLPDSPKTT